MSDEQKQQGASAMELSMQDLKELVGGGAAAPQGSTVPWQVGQNYLIRTVTMTLTGRLIEVHPTELVLEDAAWIADTGRFADAVNDGTLSEVEPFTNDVIVGRGALVDATVIDWDLPRVQK